MARHILVVDDEPDITTFLAALLEDEGYRVRTAASGEEGLALLRQDSFDLVLLDHRMPGQTGSGMYAELQKDERLRRIPVILVTGMGRITFLDEACRLATPPAAVVEKPIDHAALLAAVRYALDALPPAP